MILDDQEPRHLSAILALYPIMHGVLVAPRHSDVRRYHIGPIRI
jgi:hypothetical protein